ncbi:MAG TPA: DUF58 domain-containing protein [Chloroflexota bacterium]
MTARRRDGLALLGMTLLLLTAVYRAEEGLEVLAATALVALFIARYWGRHALDGVAYERMLGDQRAFAGDTLDLSVRLTNGKLLPLPLIEISDPVPLPLAVSDGSHPSGMDEIHHAVSLGWHERIAWRHRLSCRRRGVYSLGPATATSGDPFGLFTTSRVLGGATALIVYPRLVPVEALQLPPAYPQGERRAERWIFEDPSRTVGAREYRRGDTLRRIHWKATARRQELQTRVYEPTTDVEIALFLALGTFQESPGAGADEPFERAVSVAASLAHHFVIRGFPVGMYANGGTSRDAGPLEIAPGSGSAQVTRILETLAAVDDLPSAPAALYLTDRVPKLPWGATAMVIGGCREESLGLAVDALRKSGRRVEVMAIGS